jgi:hypothetical protein
MLLAVTFTIGFGFYSILRLGPEFHMISLRNKDYVFSIEEVLKHPFSPFVSNLKISTSYLWYFLTPPIFTAVLLGLFHGNRNNFRQVVFLAIIAGTPLIIQSSIAKVLTARYILYITPYLLILAAFGLNHIKSHIRKIVMPLTFVWPVLLIAFLILKPETLNLPRSEKSGYFELWTAGYGIKEASEHLKREALSGKTILVGTEGYFGTLPNGLEMYLNKYRNVRIVGIGLYPDRVPDPLVNSIKDNDVYLLINDSRLKMKEPEKLGLKLIASYPKVTQPSEITEHLLFFRFEGK